MNLDKGIKYLALVLIVISCKKQPPPDTGYILERDYLNEISPTETPCTPTPVPQVTYTPTAADSITAVFVCEKGRYLSVYGGGGFMNSFRYYEGQTPLSFDSLMKSTPNSISSNMIQFAQADSNNVTIIYPKGNYVIHSTKGYPNCILDHFPVDCGACYRPGSVEYKIRYYNVNHNTDKIYSPGNGYFGTAEADINIKAYSCSSGKRCNYSILFENYSYYKINGKWFVWINRISDSRESGH